MNIVIDSEYVPNFADVETRKRISHALAWADDLFYPMPVKRSVLLKNLGDDQLGRWLFHKVLREIEPPMFGVCRYVAIHEAIREVAHEMGDHRYDLST